MVRVTLPNPGEKQETPHAIHARI